MGPLFSKINLNKNDITLKHDNVLQSNNDIENETVIINVDDVTNNVLDPTPTMLEPALDPVLDPTPTTLEPVLDPTPTTLEPVLDPTPTTLEPALDPTPTTLEPALDPTPTTLEPIVEAVDEQETTEPTLTIIVDNHERSISNDSIDKANKRKRRKCRQKY